MPEDGSSEFVYTPYENKTGKDSFTYVAVDAVGNSSDPATVKIKIEKPNTKVTYADMDATRPIRCHPTGRGGDLRGASAWVGPISSSPTPL